MKKQLPGFLCGCLTTVTALALGTTALAASGQVTFHFANVALDGETKITAGSTITAPNGQKIPGSILYTDTAGGKTNYLPIRAIRELLGVEVGYDSATRTVYLGQQPASQPITTMQRWQREIDGSHVTYICGEEGHTYQTPPAWRLTWTASGWSVAEIRHDSLVHSSAYGKSYLPIGAEMPCRSGCRARIQDLVPPAEAGPLHRSTGRQPADAQSCCGFSRRPAGFGMGRRKGMLKK